MGEEGERKLFSKIGKRSVMIDLYERGKREVPCVLIHDAGYAR